MRRAIAIVLLVFLPLQWGWAAAAAYCQHETLAAGAHWGHFGHHDHAHAHGPVANDGPAPAVEVGAADPASAEALADGAAGHADCGMCQLSSAPAVMPAVSLPLDPTSGSLPRSEVAAWPDSPSEPLYRPPLSAAA